MMLTPESLRNQLMDSSSPYDRYYFDFHSPTHLNTGNYFIGLVIGYFYYQFKQAGKKHRKTLFLSIIWHLSYIMTFVLCFVGLFFYKNDIEKGIWSAFLGAFFKHIYAPVLGVLLLGIIFRYGFFIPRWYNYGMYRVLARLSFSVYMVHVSIASVFITGFKNPIEVNNATLNAFTGAVYLIRWEKFTAHWAADGLTAILFQSCCSTHACSLHWTAFSCSLQNCCTRK